MTSLILKWFRSFIYLSIHEMFDNCIILRIWGILLRLYNSSITNINFQVRFIEI